MVAGFKLNDLGMGTTEAIASFDLERELIAVLADKAGIGAQLHSDYCRIAGRTVADWLAPPDGIPDFLHALVSAGWIRRGAELNESRFWRLLDDERAPMFGVFDGYEKQLIGDWIADAPPDGSEGSDMASVHRPNVNRFRRSGPARAAQACEDARLGPDHPASVGQVIRRQLADVSAADQADDDVRSVAERLTDVDETAVAIDALQGFLSPANHSSPAGLLATRICSGLIGR
jgi:hypothetical protein